MTALGKWPSGDFAFFATTGTREPSRREVRNNYTRAGNHGKLHLRNARFESERSVTDHMVDGNIVKSISIRQGKNNKRLETRRDKKEK